jgi:hypothetical protein
VTGRHRSPLVRFLRDPSSELVRAFAHVEHAALHLLPFVAGTCALALAVVVALRLLGRLRERRLAEGARLIQVGVPPELDADGALLLWLALHDVLRPRLARLLGSQPQLAWEIAADRAGSRFRLWVPGAVPPGLVERALASAWPGITTSVEQSVENDREEAKAA